MKCSWILVALVPAFAAGGCGSEETLSSSEGRIIGGTPTGDLPAVGAIVYNGRQGCTGTLIGPRRVLTAGHCVHGRNAATMRFVIGPSLSSAQAVLRVASARPHPSYRSQSLAHDIGLLILSQDAPVKPMVKVAQLGSATVGKQLYFVGYGVTNGYSGSGSGTKRGVWIPVNRVNSSTFSYAQSGRNTCGGDSGGPAFVVESSGTFLLAGVTSYGDKYCTGYGVDTRVDRYLDFAGLGAKTPPQPTAPCKGETFKGRCSAGKVIWCESGEVHQQDCAASSKVCGYDGAKGYYACQAPVAVDPCKGETFKGRCSAGKVIWCEDQQVRQQSCAATGRSCAWSASKGYYGCL